MATELQPPDQPPVATVSPTTNNNTPTTATTTTATVEAPTPATTATAALSSQPDNPGLPLAPKRQRRPSVRLGEIGDQPAATLSHDSHVRSRAKNPSSSSSWRHHHHLHNQNQNRFNKDHAKSVKARSLTNLVNGSDSYDEDNNNNNGDNNNSNHNYHQHNRKALKSKRVSTTKRVRSNWVTRLDGEGAASNVAAAKSDSREDFAGDEGFRDFDQDSDSPLKEDQSPVHSVDNVALDSWHNRHHHHRRSGRVRVSDDNNDYAVEMDNNSKCEGVRTWLIELGLSRYAPVFEIHEVDDEVLPMLTLEDLKDMGINAVGSRRKLYTAIQKLRNKGFS